MVESFYSFLAALGYDHPVHPIFVHITIGLVFAAFVFLLIAIWRGYDKYALTARHCVVFAFITVFPTYLFGFADWIHFYGGGLSRTFEIKITLGTILIVLLGVAVYLSLRYAHRDPKVLASFLAAFLVVVGLGYYGGELIHGSAQPAAAEAEDDDDDDDAVSYAQIDQIMQDACVHCHQAGNEIWDLNLSSHENLMAGSKNGPIVVPGEPNESELVKRIDGTVEPQMPLGGAELSERDVERIIRWVEQGAPGPGE